MTGKLAKKFIISALIGSGLGIIFSSILIFIMAAILAIGNIPAMLISPATVATLAFGGLLGGFISAKFSKEKGFLCGAFSGTIYSIILLISGGFLCTDPFGTGIIIKALMIIIASSLGGIIGVNSIKK